MKKVIQNFCIIDTDVTVWAYSKLEYQRPVDITAGPHNCQTRLGFTIEEATALRDALDSAIKFVEESDK